MGIGLPALQCSPTRCCLGELGPCPLGAILAGMAAERDLDRGVVVVCYRPLPRSIQTFNGKKELSVWRRVMKERDLEVGQPCSSKLESYVIVEDEEPGIGTRGFPVWE